MIKEFGERKEEAIMFSLCVESMLPSVKRQRILQERKQGLVKDYRAEESEECIRNSIELRQLYCRTR